MVLKRGKFGKPRRGGSHHFSSSRDPNAYVTSRTPRNDDESEDEGSGSDVEQVQDKLSVIDIGGKQKETEEGEEEEEESSAEEEEKQKTPNTASKPEPSKQTPKQPHELSRREREAIEKERARQHFLKMKEKEDASRLAEIRKKREQEAAAHATMLKDKEAARLSRRQ